MLLVYYLQLLLAIVASHSSVTIRHVSNNYSLSLTRYSLLATLSLSAPAIRHVLLVMFAITIHCFLLATRSVSFVSLCHCFLLCSTRYVSNNSLRVHSLVTTYSLLAPRSLSPLVIRPVVHVMFAITILYLLLATRYLLLVTRYSLLATRFLLVVSCYRCSPLVTRHLSCKQ